MAELNVDKCAVFDWCRGHEVGEAPADLELHDGELVLAQAARSSVGLNVSVGGEFGTEFWFDINYWSVTPDTIEAEMADLRNILDQFEAAMRRFVTAGEVTR
jgi:hypothetical protein